MSRLRTRSVADGPGWVRTALQSGLTSDSGGPGVFGEWCVDVVGNYPNPNDFQVKRYRNYSWYASGRIGNWWDTSNIRAGSGFPLSGSGIPSSGSSIPSNNDAFAKGLYQSNPNRPIVDAPVFVFELRDIPKMLKGWGRVISKRPSFSGGKNLKELPRSVAQTYIEYQFGILPFIRDLGKILDFQAAIDKKLNVLERLGLPGGTTRSGLVWKDSVSQESGWVYATALYQESRRLRYATQVERHMWTSTNWKPAVPLPQTADDKRWLATRLAFGLDISFSTLWEAMPWSWLIDWFSNAGDIASLSRNTIPVTHANTCLMHDAIVHGKTVETDVPSGSTLEVTWPSPIWSHKTRTVMGSGIPGLSFNIPFVDGNQMAILSSLAVLKMPRL